ncbi:MAG TPA: radical SAM family heme chaperone HemW [Longimicrobiales bacterium]|nr:radical SAM family heme chaperone HemW [Longimicrobiales bacterium]
MTPEYLYIHVPFCVRRCSYCDFAVTATPVAPVDAWLESVAAELGQWRARHGWGLLPLRTIYVGGGTPSLLGTGAMARLGDTLRRHARWDADVEWTAEANPESFTEDLARDWVAAGINRVSMGAQTFHEPALRWMGRMHGPEGPAAAFDAARAAGLDNVSIDLIFGLPERLGRDWGTDLDRALALRPTHVSLYGLTAEPATPLGRWVGSGREALAGEEQYAAEYLLAAERLGAAGFRHYEVSSFALPGRESRHNRAYWQHEAYVGLGPGAHSFVPPVRSWNVRDWAEYRRRLQAGESAEDGRETLTADDVALERVWLGLRADSGLGLDALSPAQAGLVGAWVEAGWARSDERLVRLTRHGWLLLDKLAVELESRRA